MKSVEQLRYLVLAAQREGNRTLARQLRPLGLTPSQAEVIRLVGAAGQLTIGGLGELLICETGTNPSRLVNGLVSNGCLKKVSSNQDKRQILVTLSAVGSVANREIAKIESSLYDEIDKRLRDKDLVLVIELLGGLVAGTPAGMAFKRRLSRPTGSDEV